MTCDRVGHTIVCGRATRRPLGLCVECGRHRATILCDGPVVERSQGTTTRRTCDKALCEACATQGGPGVHYCSWHAAPERRKLEL